MSLNWSPPPASGLRGSSFMSRSALMQHPTTKPYSICLTLKLCFGYLYITPVLNKFSWHFVQIHTCYTQFVFLKYQIHHLCQLWSLICVRLWLATEIFSEAKVLGCFFFILMSLFVPSKDNYILILKYKENNNKVKWHQRRFTSSMFIWNIPLINFHDSHSWVL